jgi:hypothetical protein
MPELQEALNKFWKQWENSSKVIALFVTVAGAILAWLRNRDLLLGGLLLSAIASTALTIVLYLQFRTDASLDIEGKAIAARRRALRWSVLVTAGILVATAAVGAYGWLYFDPITIEPNKIINHTDAERTEDIQMRRIGVFIPNNASERPTTKEVNYHMSNQVDILKKSSYPWVKIDYLSLEVLDYKPLPRGHFV